MTHVVTSRFIKCIKHLKETGAIHSFRSFALSLDFHAQSLHDIIKEKRNVTIDLIAKVVEHYQLNAQYLYTGKGDMFLNGEPTTLTEYTKGNIGYVPVAAQAGYGGQVHTAILESEMPHFNLPGYDYKTGLHRCFDISGDSMEPTLFAGDKVVCSSIDVNNWHTKIRDGFVYIVITMDSVYVKRVNNKLKAEQLLVLNSDNSFYEPFEVPVIELKEVWEVEVVISSFNASPKNVKRGVFDQVDDLKTIVDNQTQTIKLLNTTIEKLIKSSRSR